MPASSAFSFGVHILSPTWCQVYENGAVYVAEVPGDVDECTDHPDRMANPYVAIVALDTGGFRVGRYEARTAPGGTLLDAQDFNGAAGTLPAGWTGYNGTAPSCLQDGAGRLYIAGSGLSEIVYAAVPVGAMYFELQNCIFDDTSHSPGSGWGMIAPYWPGPSMAAWYGQGAYRVRFREMDPQPGSLIDCTAHIGGGWMVGAVRVA